MTLVLNQHLDDDTYVYSFSIIARGWTKSSRRWNGNYKTPIRRLAEVPTSKKLKFNVTAYGQTKQLSKQRQESIEHVLTKAIIWKIFMDESQDDDDDDDEQNPMVVSMIKFEIEMDIGDPHYTPDVVGIMPKPQQDDEDDNDGEGDVLFWGESGRMKPHKAVDLMRRYSNARIIHCRWGIDLDTFVTPFMDYFVERIENGEIEQKLSSWWNGQFSFATLPADVWRYIDEDTNNTITVTKSDLSWRELDMDLINKHMARKCD
jgi:hypothetical protein